MHRRDALKVWLLACAGLRVTVTAQAKSVTTLIGTGVGGYSDQQVNNPYGLVIGPDGALYFCDLDNQRIRRLDLRTRQATTVAGNGQRGRAGDGAPATEASLNMPHEIQFDSNGHLYIAERDNHVVRKVEAKTGTISTFAGTGTAGFSGDGGPASRAQLRQPHSIAVDSSRNYLLICDIGNHRIRRIEFATGVIDTFGGTGERQPTPDGAPLQGTPLNGPRTIVFDGPATCTSPSVRVTRSIASMAAPRRFITSPAPANRATLAMAVRRGWRGWLGQRAWPGGMTVSMSPIRRVMWSAKST